jgi:hypothetical protein|tara:strand:+ start:335 stop:463 length:129 start_codon:yes stop_codon:yes gene_type:complete
VLPAVIEALSAAIAIFVVDVVGKKVLEATYELSGINYSFLFE